MSPLVVAHRGVSGLLDENTIPAFEAAISVGADMVEFDVWRCGTGELVVIHDGSVRGRPVSGLSHLELIELSGRPVPLLQTVLELTRNRIGVDVELKDPSCAPEVTALVRDQPSSRIALISSFSPEAVAAVRAIDPQARLGLIWARPLAGRGPEELTRWARSLGATHLVPHHRLLRPPLIAEAGAAGLGLLPWTVNGPRSLRRCLSVAGLWGVVTDRVRLAMEVRRQLGQNR